MGGGIGGMTYSIRHTTDTNNVEQTEILCSHSNHRGDIFARSDSTGSLTFYAVYEAYGTRPFEWTKSGTSGNPDRQYANTKDEETDLGLLNEGMRYRDLYTGTFLTRDPIGYADGPNIYCYVHCNPITHFDALGLWDKKMHYEKTKERAQKAGFTPKEAKRIARACNGVDSIFKGKSWLPGFLGDQGSHFNTNIKKHGGADSRLIRSERFFNTAVKRRKEAVKILKKAKSNMKEAEKLIKSKNYFTRQNGYEKKRKAKMLIKKAKKVNNKALDALGESLHPLQDIYAHTPKVQKEKTFFGIHLWWYHDQGKDIDNIDKHPKAAAEAEKKTDEQFKRFKKEAPAINF